MSSTILKRTIPVTVNVYDLLTNVEDSERIELVRDLCETIRNDGVIERIRAVVNSAEFDDLPRKAEPAIDLASMARNILFPGK